MRSDFESLSRARWVTNFRKLPNGYSIVPWIKLAATDRERLRYKPWLPDELAPFRHEAGLEASTSLALLLNDHVVGWTINHLVEGTLRFTSAYVRPDLAARGRVFVLYSEAIRRMPESGAREAMCAIPVTYGAHARFGERRLRKCCKFFAETRFVERRLRDVEGKH